MDTYISNYDMIISQSFCLYIHTLSHDLRIQPCSEGSLPKYCGNEGSNLILGNGDQKDTDKYMRANVTDHWQVDLHRSMDFMNFEAFCEASPADTYISWLRISQSFCETLSSGNSSTFLRLCVTDWNNRQLRHDNLIIGGCCISESDFGSCQGAIVSELSLQIFLGDTVTCCDRFYISRLS